jgi:hypothetical protein
MCPRDSLKPRCQAADSAIAGSAVAARLWGMTNRYIGSGPYCYANCMAMALADGTGPGLLEVLTGSPFGLQLLGGRRPLFDPLGWDPEIGIGAALDLLGWSCERSGGGDAGTALERLRGATATGPVLAGPVEMGLLLHHPGAGTAIGADHYLLVLAFDGDVVCFHDPDGHPYATLPAGAFATAWRGDSIEYPHDEYTMRTGFRRIRDVGASEALRASVPAAIIWLNGRPEQAPPGSMGGGDAAVALADLAETGLTDDQREEMMWFAVRVGARRLADAEHWLSQIGLKEAAVIAGAQARIVGGLQYPLVTRDDATVAKMMRDLAPTYHQLCQALSA